MEMMTTDFNKIVPIGAYPTLDDEQFDIMEEELYIRKWTEMYNEYAMKIKNGEIDSDDIINDGCSHSDTEVNVDEVEDKNGFSYRYHTLEMIDDEMNDECFDDFDDDDYKNVVLIEEEDEEDDDTDDEYNEYDDDYEYSDMRRSRQYSYL
jgi:hypothetical protein